MLNPKKYIFTHIEKTAGTSIAEHLQKNDPDAHYIESLGYRKYHLVPFNGEVQHNYPYKHTHLRIINDMFPEKLFRFTFVRHPLTRYPSLYCYFMQMMTPMKTLREIYDNQYKYEITITEETYEQQLNSYNARFKPIPPGIHKLSFDFFVRHYIVVCRQQFDMILSYDYKPLINWCGQFEHLQEDFDQLCDMLDMPTGKLNLVNEQKGNEIYEAFWTNSLKNFVKERDKRELDHFNYRM